MRGSQDNETIYRTRKERQKRERRRNRKAFRRHLSWAGMLGIATGLSLNSLILSYLTQGTAAMLTAQATSTVSFSAAAHFPRWYDDLVNQIGGDTSSSGSLLAAMRHKRDSARSADKPISDVLSELERDANQIAAWDESATGCFNTIEQAANQDESQVAAVMQQTPNEQATIASYERVAAWGQTAESQALSYLGQIHSNLATADDIVASVQKMISEDAKKPKSGNPSSDAVTVTKATYGRQSVQSGTLAAKTVSGATYDQQTVQNGTLASETVSDATVSPCRAQDLTQAPMAVGLATYGEPTTQAPTITSLEVSNATYAQPSEPSATITPEVVAGAVYTEPPQQAMTLMPETVQIGSKDQSVTGATYHVGANTTVTLSYRSIINDAK